MSDFDPRFDPAYQPGFDPSKHRSAPVPPPLNEDVGAPPADPPAPAPVAVSAPAPTPTSRVRRNPLLITLWVLSALLVASGFYGFRLIGDRVAVLGDSGFGGADYYLLQSYVFLAPLLIFLGLATALGTIFILAVRWTPR